MSKIIPLPVGAERAPDTPEGKDRVIFQLSENWKLGFDPLQWIILRARNRRGQREWRPVTFIPSKKLTLERCIAEKGIQPTPEARAKLDALPDTFKEWLAEQKCAESA